MEDIVYKIFEDSIFRGILYLLAFIVLYFTLAAIVINTIDWIRNIFLSTKQGWFQLTSLSKNSKILTMKYQPYIVGFPSGEIFYVNEKKLKKLKKANLLSWDRTINRYAFNDNNIDLVIKKITPVIEIYVPHSRNS